MLVVSMPLPVSLSPWSYLFVPQRTPGRQNSSAWHDKNDDENNLYSTNIGASHVTTIIVYMNDFFVSSLIFLRNLSFCCSRSGPFGSTSS